MSSINSNSKRKGFLIVWLVILFTGITSIYWYYELKYQLPTPIPENYKEIKVGSLISLNDHFTRQTHKPVFIHFYNPECPCSKFTIPHIKSLLKKYHDKLEFAVVVMNNQDNYSIKEIQSVFDSSIKVLFDPSIATACGVYSTPQAVILEPNSRLYFRGNYNKSRYCTDKKYNYAEMAIDSLIRNIKSPSFSSLALKAYGCELPKCKKP